MIICPMCGAENPDSAEFCSLCLAGMGFDSAEEVVPAPKDDTGLLRKYPSSFSQDATDREESQPSEEKPDAPPVEIGEYGTRTGQDVEETVLPEARRRHLGPPNSGQKHRG